MVDGVVTDKCGTAVAVDSKLTVKQRPRYVSRAGDKLAHALLMFPVVVTGRTALDVGASTGGFVDCLLQNGAARVVALDVGRGQLDAKLRSDERVLVLEGVNARYLNASDLPYEPDLLTMDVSFISVHKVLPAVCACMAAVFEALILIKPQFEAGPQAVGKGGIVRNPAVWSEVLARATTFATEELSLDVRGVSDSGLRGTEGNREFFVWLSRGGEQGLDPDNLAEEINRVVHGETISRNE